MGYDVVIIQIFVVVFILGLIIGNTQSFAQEDNSEIKIAITPDKVKYGESLLFQYSLSSYNKPDEERYAFNVVNPEGAEIDSTLWYARQDSEYKFETSHPTYNIVKAGKYSLNFEKAIKMERTGEIVETVFFEITTNPPPLVQSKRGVNLDDIICNEGLDLIVRYDNSPSCVKPESIPKLIERGWANANFQPIYSNKQIESGSPNWGIGENLHQGDFFSYSLCHFSYKECQPFEISFWIKSISQDSSQIVFTVYDGNKEIKNEYKLENGQLIPTDPKNATLLEYIDLFKDSVLFLDRFASIDGWGDSGPKNFSEKSWGTYETISGTQVSPNGTEYVGMPAGNYESNLIVFTQFQKINKIWVVDEIPFPVKAVVWDETYLQPVLTYEFLLLQYGNSSEDPFSIHLSYPAQE